MIGGKENDKLFSRSEKPPYSIVGVSFNRREMRALTDECVRSEQERSEVIKQALNYWLTLDPGERDEAVT